MQLASSIKDTLCDVQWIYCNKMFCYHSTKVMLLLIELLFIWKSRIPRLAKVCQHCRQVSEAKTRAWNFLVAAVDGKTGELEVQL